MYEIFDKHGDQLEEDYTLCPQCGDGFYVEDVADHWADCDGAEV